ncbi:hypothetical protein BJY16_006138 [Actinoplanes octamycinicus]|uniref:Uncharacterized protein n=1 Tax=Actinoplanes octamycinicus TaxID=135948 RepID=A0A7W7H2L6_9ACTN|nr:hypothetical protein [Actinoplanes octamycinicus]MBB4742679.1 hypothetical protein [Actinoplanes octamycinicus]GIE62982.1 hypothetical protein Aoc01nite_83840 [Actinoplanes octamycinicus]
MQGIAGYRPVACTTVDQVRDRHGRQLRDLAGRRLTSATALCFTCDGEWCSTGVLILDFDGPRLELCGDGFDELYLSFGTIDVRAPIDSEDQDDPDLRLAWADPAQPELDALLGRPLQEARILESEYRFHRAEDGRTSTGWLLRGLELHFAGDRALRLTNILSEIRLDTDPLDHDGWRAYLP